MVMYVTIMNIYIMYTHSFELFSYSIRGLCEFTVLIKFTNGPAE